MNRSAFCPYYIAHVYLCKKHPSNRIQVMLTSRAVSSHGNVKKCVKLHCSGYVRKHDLNWSEPVPHAHLHPVYTVHE